MDTKSYIRRLLREISIPGGERLRLPQEPDIDKEVYKELKKIDPEDIELEVGGNDGYSIIYMDVKPKISKDISDSIVLNIQLIGEEEPQLYQPHISIHENIQGLGLATKIYKAVIKEFGHLYSGSGRRQSGIASKIWKKLDSEGDITCDINSEYNICIHDTNPQKEELLAKASGGNIH